MSFYLPSFIWSILAFLVLYWLLNKYAFGPLFAVMEKRREHVLTEIQSAEKSRKDAEQYLTDQKAAIDQARKEAYEIVEQAKKSSAKQAEGIVEQARTEADRIKDNALREIESEKNKAISELRNQVGAMSVMIASKIIEKQVDEKAQKELVDQYLKEVGGNV